ncbi:hypothetical protein CKA55_07985 [Arcobacter suis]|uniref:Uncharacterized protein n=1 Tax=Arcobacter suis CECT 7833 TaxID=663365 RepID=A0AAD0WR34_9BACT|nr:hypothetical protein [Arcobacter suis]AXX89877.1 hypothetical protein ASUIS_1395 [Arcobacter suis CECT 7833]RWS46403.1 hypothetical protein CKA55_07985 [Arcobacter suis]
MITSNIDSIIAQISASNNSNTTTNSNSFLTTLVNNSTTNTTPSTKTNSLSYENIKGITLEEIDTLFVNEDDKSMAKNLRLATLFSSDDYLSKALFNTVLGEPFNVGFSYLSSSYEDKNIFLSSSNNSLADLLHESITQKVNNPNANSTDVISQDRLDEILTKVNSFNFISALSNTSKRGYDKYKDEKNDYSFLYNDYNLKYQELVYKYQELEDINKTMIKQF